MLSRTCLPQLARQLPSLSSMLQAAQEVGMETSSCSSSPSTSYTCSPLISHPYQTCFTRGMAFKKAGGTARQNPDTLSRNLGVKFLANEVVFPGHIIVRQRGTKWHPGHNVGMGKDHTIFATSVGLVQFSRQEITYPSGRSKERTVVNVVPINGDWSPAYKQLQEDMVVRRAVIKRQMIKSRAVEAALHFPMPKHTLWSVPISAPPQQQQQAPGKATASKQVTTTVAAPAH